MDALIGLAVAAFFIWLLVRRYGSPSITRDPPKFRDGGTLGFKGPEPTLPGERIVGKHPALAHPYGESKRPPRSLESITLTPRQTERVNIQRKLRGQPPLNRNGFKNAIAHAWDQPRRQPDTATDWLTYLILYECLFADHQSHTVSGTGGLTIDPNLPYNGQGGEFAGAGASGDWKGIEGFAAAASYNSASVADGVVSSYQRSDAAFDTAPSDPGSYQPGETVGGYGASKDPDPSTPSTPTPSVSDSSSSYSSSTPSSDSSSSSSSSSSDGGGGGGGGDGG